MAIAYFTVAAKEFRSFLASHVPFLEKFTHIQVEGSRVRQAVEVWSALQMVKGLHPLNPENEEGGARQAPPFRTSFASS